MTAERYNGKHLKPCVRLDAHALFLGSQTMSE
jgi:hypothetical protein